MGSSVQTAASGNSAASGWSSVISAKNSCTVIGDSIFAYGCPNAGGVPSAGLNSNSSIYWYNTLAHANGYTGFDVLFSRAVVGHSLEDLIANQLTPTLTDGTECVWAHCMINNLASGSANNSSIANIVAQTKTILDALSPVKKVIIWDSANPLLQSGSNSARARAWIIPAANAAVRSLCSAYPNVIFNDTYSAMVNTASTALDVLTRMVRTDDGIHLVSEGAQKAGYASFNNISKRLNVTKHKTLGSNLLSVVGTTGTGTKTVGSGAITNTGSNSIPTDWNVQVVTGSGAVTVTQLAPNSTSFAITNAGGTSSTIYFQAINNVALTAAIVAGDVVQAGFNYQVHGSTLLQYVQCFLRFNGSVIRSAGAYDAASEPTLTYPQTASGGSSVTLPYIVPSNPSNVEFVIAINVAATTGATTVDISEAFLSKLI